MFSDQLLKTMKELDTLVCCGLDPRIKAIQKKYMKDAEYWLPTFLVREYVAEYGKEKGRAKVVEDYLKGIVQAVNEHVAAYKPNIAYFEALGSYGLKTLRQVIDFIHEETGKVVILDVKLNDIGASAFYYGIAFFDWLGADAVTVNPYLGSDTITPLLAQFVKDGKGLFVLCKTSNPSASEFQDVTVDTAPLFERVAEKIKEWGHESKGDRGYSNVGAVVGATYHEQLANLRKKLANQPLLIPGLGVQGGEPEEVARLATDEEGLGAIFNSSRGINFAYQRLEYPEEEWMEAAEESARRLKEKLNQFITAGS